MTFDNPLKNFDQSAIDRLLERARRDQALVDSVIHPFGSLGKKNFESDAIRLKRLTENLVSIRMSEEAAKLKSLTELNQSSIDSLSSWSRLSAMREATLAVAQQRTLETNNFGKLAMAVSDQLNAVTKLGYTHTDLLHKATASSRLGYVAMRTGSLSQFHEIATRASSISAQLERLANEQSSWRGSSAIDAVIVRHVREAQIAMEAMVAEESAEGFVSHANGLLKALAGLFSRFKGNTSNEVRDMGLFGFLAAILSFLAIWDALQPDGLSEADRERLMIIQSDVREVREQLLKILEGEAAIDEAFVSDLPRGITRRKAYIRVHPKQQSELIIVLPDDTPVAIYEQEKRWLKVVYRDPLADQLALGWVYKPTIEEMAD